MQYSNDMWSISTQEQPLHVPSSPASPVQLPPWPGDVNNKQAYTALAGVVTSDLLEVKQHYTHTPLVSQPAQHSLVYAMHSPCRYIDTCNWLDSSLSFYQWMNEAMTALWPVQWVALTLHKTSVTACKCAWYAIQRNTMTDKTPGVCSADVVCSRCVSLLCPTVCSGISHHS